MGLDTTHDAWHGPYSAFNNWRTWIASKIGIPLKLMDGFYCEHEAGLDPFLALEYMFPDKDDTAMYGLRELKKQFPLKWEAFKPSKLHTLLNHSDCDGEISWEDCKGIHRELMKIINSKPDDMDEYLLMRTNEFADGCFKAYKRKEVLKFH